MAQISLTVDTFEYKGRTIKIRATEVFSHMERLCALSSRWNNGLCVNGFEYRIVIGEAALDEVIETDAIQTLIDHVKQDVLSGKWEGFLNKIDLARD